jgi:hypothetical protein
MEMFDNKDDESQADPNKTRADKLIAWISKHTDVWREQRKNLVTNWDNYENAFYGRFTGQSRDSERSRFVSPATQQAVETRHAEIMEALQGTTGRWFDIVDDIKDVNGSPLDIEELSKTLQEDLKSTGSDSAISEIVLHAMLFGSGIGEVVTVKETEAIPATKAVKGITGVAQIGIETKEVTKAYLNPVHPRNFLIDVTSKSVKKALGCAIERQVALFEVADKQANGIYLEAEVKPVARDHELKTMDDMLVQDTGDLVTVLTYYGKVPRALLPAQKGDEGVVDLFDKTDNTDAEDYKDLVEAIVIIGNGSVVLKENESPWELDVRPIVSYQDDFAEGFYGRGTAEKAQGTQRALDAQLRAHFDSLALTTAPMIAMDSTRLPRGTKFEVRPGKAILTNGNPSDILMPLKFGVTSNQGVVEAQNIERMLLQATGTTDGLSAAAAGAGQHGMPAAVAQSVKRYRRALVSFQDSFLIPFVKMVAYRMMQLEPERYPSVDMKFVPVGTMGVLQREFESAKLIGLLQTLGPNTPVLPILLKGIIASSSVTNRAEITAMLDGMSKPKAPSQLEEVEVATKRAELALLNAKVAHQLKETELLPVEMQAKLIAAATNNLMQNDQRAFDQRIELARTVLLEQKQDFDMNNNGIPDSQEPPVALTAMSPTAPVEESMPPM